MTHLYYLPDNLELEINKAETILEASLEAGIPHTHACGGQARCSTCRVMILEGLEGCAPRNEKEQILADKLHFSPAIRLACQTRCTGKVKIRRLVIDAEDLELADQFSERQTGAVGQEKFIAILFADIRGFTSFSESVPAYDVIHVLNRYFSKMSEVIVRNRGYICNYMGDGLMALFGVENPVAAAAEAVQAGLEMLEAMEEFNPYLEMLYRRKLQIGVGIHYGEAVVGNIGAINNQKMTAIGDAVNFASRIESANKEAGTRLLISEETYNLVKQFFHFGKQVSLTLKGKSGEYLLYEVQASKVVASIGSLK